ncbi:response regulator [Rathayibacter sp. KR2-224]|uniref:response regulator n=1 Tax=Rathayibacter sp. KR2-224 TaxID=3400913 RepID=UPI003BFB7E53
MSARTRVVIADDQPLIREGVARVLSAQHDLEVAGVATDGIEAVELVAEATPDVALLDIRMPRLDGIEATRRILSGEHDATPRILIMTTFNLDAYVYEALRAGASGFLLKDARPAKLLDAVRTVARGEALIDPGATRALIGEFGTRIRPPLADQRAAATLTAREREVLRLLPDGRSNAEIADALVVTRETVKTYVSRLLLKLGLRDRVQAVVYAYRAGLVDD